MFKPLTQRLAATAAVLFASAAASAQPAEPAAPARKPNVVIFLIDDLGYADVGYHGIRQDVRTPNIDAIAQGGVRFTQGYVTCPVCAPSRVGLLTGQYPQRFGFEFNPGPGTPDIYGIPPEPKMLQEVLKGAGYATGMIGKWHLGFRAEQHPTRRGFDEFFGFLPGAHGYFDTGEGRSAVVRGTEPVKEVEYLTDAFGKEAVSFVDRNKDNPFFLYLAFNAVHTPVQVTERYAQRFADVTDPNRRKLMGMLAATDDAIGSVTARLKEHGIDDETLVIFLSDNGGQGKQSLNAPLRGQKNTVFEGGVRVPFAVRWPGRIKAGQVYDQPVSALDVVPTVLAAAGTSLPTGQATDGVDLMPFLGGAKPDAPPHQTLFWRLGDKWAVRHGNHKLVANGLVTPMLFDLSVDPNEQTDLAAAQPERVAQMKAEFDAWAGRMSPPKWVDSRENFSGAAGLPGAEGGQAPAKRRNRRPGAGAATKAVQPSNQ